MSFPEHLLHGFSQGIGPWSHHVQAGSDKGQQKGGSQHMEPRPANRGSKPMFHRRHSQPPVEQSRQCHIHKNLRDKNRSGSYRGNQQHHQPQNSSKENQRKTSFVTPQIR